MRYGKSSIAQDIKLLILGSVPFPADPAAMALLRSFFISDLKLITRHYCPSCQMFMSIYRHYIFSIARHYIFSIVRHYIFSIFSIVRHYTMFGPSASPWRSTLLSSYAALVASSPQKSQFPSQRFANMFKKFVNGYLTQLYVSTMDQTDP